MATHRHAIADRPRHDGRPVCKYGRNCIRTNPQHFVDFDHPGLSPPHSDGYERSSVRLPTSASVAAAHRGRDAGTGRRRKCKFGCGRPVARHRDGGREYDTCCRACVLCQGAGRHDEKCAGGAVRFNKHGSGADPEMQAFMSLDQALELRRRAKALCAVGKMDKMQDFLLNSVEQLQVAREQLPAGHRLEGLMTAVLSAWSRANENILTDDARTGKLEQEIEATMDKIMTELDATLYEATKKRARGREGNAAGGEGNSNAAAGRGGGKGKAFGKGRSNSNIGWGASSSSSTLPPPPPPPRSRLRSGNGRSTSTSSLRDGRGTARPPRQSAGARSGSTTTLAVVTEPEPGAEEVGTTAERAQAALRVLGLDDQWPTELTLKEIRRRYMREALNTHPDKGPPEEVEERTSKFQEISDAFSALEVFMAIFERDGEGGPTEDAPQDAAHGEPLSLTHMNLVPTRTMSTRGLEGAEGGAEALPSRPPIWTIEDGEVPGAAGDAGGGEAPAAADEPADPEGVARLAAPLDCEKEKCAGTTPSCTKLARGETLDDDALTWLTKNLFCACVHPTGTLPEPEVLVGRTSH